MMNPIGKHIVVVGGGITGLAATYHLQELKRKNRLDFKITLLDAKDRLGGIIETERKGEFLLEGGPDSFISDKPWALDLCHRLGLEKELIETQDTFRQSFILKNNKLIPVPKGFYLIAPKNFGVFLGTKLVSFLGKLRMFFELFIPKRKMNTDESVGSFVKRRFGKEALDRLGQPMIGGIYTADPEKLSLKATFPKFIDMEKNFGSVIRGLKKQDRTTGAASGPRYSLFVTLKGGIQTLVDRLISELTDVEIKLKSPVSEIKKDSYWQVHLVNGEVISADAVLLTLPAHQASHILAPASEKIASELSKIEYESVATVNIGFRREDVKHPLNGFGFVVPRIENRGIVGCTFSHVKFEGRAAKDDVLLRAFVGGAFGHEMYEMDDEGLEIMVLDELKQILKIKGNPLFISIKRYPRSMPQYTLGHLERIARIEDELVNIKNLKLAGSAYRGVGIPDCIRDAEVAAKAIVNELVEKELEHANV